MLTGTSFSHEAYREILRQGTKAGYTFADFASVRKEGPPGGPSCLLRHDCDNDLAAAARLAEIEAEEGVCSTWFVMLRSAMYNLLAPRSIELVKGILAKGHWIGLHFDESVIFPKTPAAIVDGVKRERDILEDVFAASVRAVSFHQPSPEVLKGELQLPLVNTYGKKDMGGYYYTSDSNMNFRSGHPTDLFREQRPRLHLLIHPEWWTPEPMSIDDKWDRMLLNNFSAAQSSLLEREATFTRARRLKIVRDRS